MNILSCFYRISIKALVEDSDGKILFIQEKDGHWELPGGGMDHGESAHDCLEREIFEEMQLPVAFIAPQPSYFLTFRMNSGVWRAQMIYKTILQHLDFTPSDECVAIKFFTKEEILQEDIRDSAREFIRIFEKNKE